MESTSYGWRMRQLILDGYANRAVVRMLRREFPGCRATAGSIASKRSNLRREGQEVVSSPQAPKQRANYSHVNSSALTAVQTIIDLAIEAIDAGFNKEDAAAWVRLNA